MRDNIAGFGGDPDNVTVFGESAGGCSVVTLLATPAAKGLFHKAIAQSASVAQVRTRDAAGERAALFLDDLGVAATDLERLADIPLEQILEAQGRLTTRRRGRGFSGADMQAFSPSPDGTSLLELPLDAIESGSAADIPVIAGTNRDEIRLFAVWDPSLQNLDRDGAIARLRGALGDDARARLSTRTPRRARVSLRARSRWRSHRTRRSAWTRCGWPTRSTRSATPAYTYLFTWQSPALDGRLGACHALEIPFVFDNVHQPGVELLTGSGDDRAPLAKIMNAAWAAFARSGVPDHPGMPAWPVYDPARRPTMVFDNTVEVVEDPLGSDRKAWSQPVG